MTRRPWALAGLLTLALAGCQALAPRPGGGHGRAPATARAARDVPADPPPVPEPAPVPPTDRPAVPAPVSVLVLSGGGAYGAYSAGVLAGWSEAGTRPAFDVVTGVSTGALIATLAFLGPESDPALRRFYTTVTDRDVFAPRPGLAVLFGDALADSRPLERLINRAVDADVLRRVAAEHAQGRRLYVGTTHLAARRPVVWDMGAIAARGRPEDLALFRRVLLASASMPGLLPPVPIRAEVDGRVVEELHVDGGVTASLFFPPPGAVPARAEGRADRAPPGSAVYVVVAGKLYADPEPVRPRVLPIVGGSVSALVHAQTRGDLFRVYAQARAAGLDYRLAAVPDGVRLPPSSTSFDPASMARLYAAGRRQALSGRPWRDAPPGEEAVVRGGPRPGTEPAAGPPADPVPDRPPIPPAAADPTPELAGP